MQISLFGVETAPTQTNDYRIVDPNDHSLIDRIFSEPYIVLDIETMSPFEGKPGNIPLNPRQGVIRLIQVRSAQSNYIFDLGGRYDNRVKLLEQHKHFFEKLRQFGCDTKRGIIGHNLQFDLRFLRWQHDFKPSCRVMCTMIGARVFYGDFGASCTSKQDSVLGGGYSLKNLSSVLLGVSVDKTEQTSDWGETLTESQLTYAAKDCEYTEQLYFKLKDMYRTDSVFGDPDGSYGLSSAWRLESSVIPAVIEIEYNGLPCNRELLQQRITEVEEIFDNLSSEWEKLSRENNETYSPFKLGEVSTAPTCPSSYAQTQKVLAFLKHKYPKLKLKKLDKEVIAKHCFDYPEFELISKLRAIKSLLDNLHGFYVSSEQDGYVHTMYRTLTGVGRFSSGASSISAAYPNLQSISAKKNPVLAEYGLTSVRDVIQPKPGYGMAVIDLSSAHGRIAAGLANDEAGIASSNDPTIDNHSRIAAYVAKEQGLNWDGDYIAKARKQKDNPDAAKADHLRSTAKNTYYGWLNGAGADTIQNQIAANMGKAPSLTVCKQALDGCRQLFNRIEGYRNDLIDRLNSNYFGFGRDRHNRVRNFSVLRPGDGTQLVYELSIDKRGNLSVPYTRAVAATWQRIEATAVKDGLLQVHRLISQHPEWELKIINVVHDEIDITFNLEYAEDCVSTVNNVFNDAFLSYLKNGVRDGRETDWTKLVVKTWAEK